MALTRKSLKTMGLNDEQVDSVIEMHAETVDALRADVERYRSDAASLVDVRRQLDEANDKLGKTDPDAAARIQQELDDYKAQVASEKQTAAKKAAYRKLLADHGITGVIADMAADAVDYTSVEMDGDVIRGSDTIGAEIEKKFADYIQKPGVSGQRVQTPPPGGNQANDDDLSDEEYFAKYKH